MFSNNFLFSTGSDLLDVRFITAQNAILQSPDGTNWFAASQLQPYYNFTINSLTYAEEISTWIMVGGGYKTLSPPVSFQVRYSSDGIVWNDVSGPNPASPPQNFLNSVWSPELSIFVCFETQVNVWYSSDGINWTSNAWGWVFNTRPTPRRVAWSGPLGLFVGAAFYNGVPKFEKSTDGINWSLCSPGPADDGNEWNGIAWGGDKFVSAISSNNPSYFITYSYNGDNWINATSYTGNPIGSLQNVAYSEDLGIFVAVGGNAQNGINNRCQVITSTDGINWEETDYRYLETTTFLLIWRGVAWNSEIKKFVVTNQGPSSGSYTLVSSDGYNWELGTKLPSTVISVYSR